jgi:hypothetical protein
MLGLREAVHKLKERGTQLLNRRERKLHLRLYPEGPGDAKVAPMVDDVLEERGLADACFAMHHQRAAAPGARAVQESIERLALSFPAEQRSS